MSTIKPDLYDVLPGSTAQDLIERMIRVDHAGEYGAVHIYEGQLAVLASNLRHRKAAQTIKRMAQQEQDHLDTFDRLIVERRVRPTALAPVWQAAGYALGAATALMGDKTAMACTVAVEEVIEEHYARQSQTLAAFHDDELKEIIETFRADEIQHRDTALAQGARQAPAYPLLSGAIKAACRLAIRISEKV